MKNYQGYLLDLDGTIYLGNKILPGAVAFIDYLKQNNLSYTFVTNNSTREPQAVVDKLKQFGIITDVSHVYTTAQATATYIEQNYPNKVVFAIGETGVISALKEKNISITSDANQADIVVMGLDTQINYQKLVQASAVIQNGAIFISTNPDVAIPLETGRQPGNGALTAAVEITTGQKATFIGKPYHIIMDLAIEAMGLAKSEIVFVGDNYDTDILAGINAEIDTIHVQTGVSTKEHVMSALKPATMSFKDLNEVLVQLDKGEN